MATLFLGAGSPIVETFTPALPVRVPPEAPVLLAQNESEGFEYEDFDFWAEQCLLLNQQQDYAQALATCEQAISLEPREDNLDIWLARGNALFHLGQYAESLISFARVIEASPNNSFAIASQCASFFHLNRDEDAIDTCEQALSIDGNWGNTSPAFAWYYRGLALHRMGRLETALTSFERAAIVDPTHLPSLAEQCRVLTELERSAELGATCLPAVSETENELTEGLAAPVAERCGASAETDRAEQLAVNQGLQATVLCYERALADDAQDITAWIQQGLALEQLGSYERAANAYGRAVALNPTHAIALAHHCGALNQIQNYEAALEACDRAFQATGGLTGWNAAYGWNQRSVALLGLERYEEALAAAHQAIETEPRYAPAWNSRALGLWWLNQAEAATAIQQAIGKYSEAATALQETFERSYPDPAIVIYRGHMLAQYNQGRILASLGNHVAAVEAYDRALAMAKQTTNHSGIEALDNAVLADIWVNQAAAYLYFNSEQALAATQNALLLDRRSFSAWYNRGLAFTHQGDAAGSAAERRDAYLCAFDAYSQAAQLSPNNLYALTGQGIALQGLGVTQEAIALFDQVLAIEPNNALAQQHRETVLAGLWDASGSTQIEKQEVPSLPIADC